MPDKTAWAPVILDRFQINGRGQVIVVAADRELDREHPEIMGLSVIVDGKPRQIVGVERIAIATPKIRVGEHIGLLLSPEGKIDAG